jgi:solute carrier family 9B (sodium/hydrogen exchanger), member 1/2
MIESIMFILLFGLLANKLFSKLKLPGLLGMILVGILLGPHGMKLLDNSIMDNSSQIRSIALIIILLRAGLGLNKEMLKKVGKVSIKMSAIPCLCEGFLILFAAMKILHLPLAEAGMLAFIIAAVSPAVVVPAMIQLKEKKLGIKKGVPILILAGSSIDDIFAITIFTIFLGMGTKKSVSTSITSQLVKIPVEILGGIILGAMAAYVLVLLFKSQVLKNSSLEKLCIVLIAAFAVYTIGQSINVSGLLSVMTIGFILLEKIEKEAKELEKGLNKIWFFAQIFLFVLIGAEVNISVAFGAGLAGIAVIIIGLVGRTIGVMISLAGSHLNTKERFFCSIAYIPKATVQAAIGGIPLASGVASGELILAIAVLAIIITAPLGAIGISVSAPRLLEDDSGSREGVA